MHSLRRPGNHFYIVLIYGFFLLCASNQFASGAENEAPALNVEQLRERFTNESSAELASFKLGDADVSLNVSGSWKATLQGNLGLSFSPTGTQAISPDTPILFTQESDVTLDLRILDKWFVEASVLNNLDNYAFNTYRAGYEGAPGELVQYAGIGNTGLDFPVFPYLDLGGDSASSFGFYGKFAAGPYTFHSLFRWDQAAREERTFVGARERSYVYVAPDDSERGVSFVLPNTMLDSDTQVFVEDEKGSLRDTDGRHWRQLGPSEYAAGRASGLVELAQSPAGMVAAAYSKGGSQTPWAEIPAGTEALGKYGDPAMPGSGSGFLGEAQGYFGQEVNLSLYPQCGETGALPHTPGSRLINGTPALVIYENGTFSPFERRSRYAAPSSASTDAALVRLPTLDLVPGYELVQLEASAITPDIPLYADSVVQRAYFDLIKENGSTDNRNPEKRWPMAADNPGFYLPGAVTSETNISIRFTNYGSPGLFVIGTDVVPGSVQVWRSGIIDPNFTFNASSGTVSLANPAGFSEVIRITYLKRSSESQMGSVAAGLGAEYHKDGSPFQSQLAMGLRWNLNQGDTFTEEGVSNPGNVGLSAKTSWEFDHLKARITGGLNFEQPDSTGLYRAAGMEGNQVILDLAPDTSFVSYPPESASAIPLFSGLDISNRSDLIYRNYRDPASVSNNLMTIDWNGSRIVPAVNRPYPVRDPQLTSKTNVLAMEFSLDDSAKWTGYQTPITDDTGILARAKEIEIPYRFYGFDGPVPPDFKLVLQIGALAGEDYSYTENTALIYEKLLYGADMADAPDNPAAFDTNARIASFTISDSDRLALGDARCIRIIVTHTGTETINGRVILAPPIIRGASFRPIILSGTTVYDAQNYSSGFTVQTQEMPETDPNSSLQSAYPQLIKRLHPDGTTQQVLYVQWDDMDSFNAAGADGRIGSLPLSSYRMMSFFLKGPQRADGTEFSDGAGGAGGVVNFFIAQGTSSFAKTGEQYITAEIPLSAFQPGKWSKVSIRYQGSEQGVYVDNKAVSGAVFKYRQLPQLVVSDLPPGKSMYTAVTISPVSLNSSAEPMQGNYLPAGNFSIDEIILEEPAPLYRLSGGMMAEYNRPGTLAAIRNFPVLADFSASSALESEVHGDPFTGGQDSGSGVSSRSNAGITVLGTKIAGNLAFNAVSGDFNWNAGHEISRSFGPFDAAESFAV
ncbi:MAG: hypothetical protein FWF29_03540, partial [Treponema sp.]|nr:hypothetical protein [Treponema sp.]